MTEIQMIPLADLFPSPENVRTVSPDKAADQELIASIEAVGLQQNLVAVQKDSHYQVIAGGRRLAAMRHLAEEGRLEWSLQVPCRVHPDGTAVEEIGLIENLQRAALHPADEFEAFKRLADRGMTPAEIARHFGVEERQVKRRMRLAGVHPEILKDFREGKLDQETVVAFAKGTADQGLQKRTYAKVKKQSYGHVHEWQVERMLESEAPRSGDRLVEFVGIDVYREAGGALEEDLFSEDTILQDTALLERLAEEKFDAERQKLLKRWGFVQGELKHVSIYDVTQGGAFTPLHRDQVKERGLKPKDLGCTMFVDHSGKLQITRNVYHGRPPRPKAEKGQKPVERYTAAVRDDFNLWRAIAYRCALVEAEREGLGVARALIDFTIAKMGLSTEFRWEVPSLLRCDTTASSLPQPPTCAGAEALAAAREARDLAWLQEEQLCGQFEAFLALDEGERALQVALAVGELMDAGDFDSLAPALPELLKENGAPVDIPGTWRPGYENLFSRMRKDALLEVGAELVDEEWSKQNAGAKKGVLAAGIDSLARERDWRPAEISAPLKLEDAL